MRLLARMPPGSRLDAAPGMLRIKASGKCIDFGFCFWYLDHPPINSR